MIKDILNLTTTTNEGNTAHEKIQHSISQLKLIIGMNPVDGKINPNKPPRILPSGVRELVIEVVLKPTLDNVVICINYIDELKYSCIEPSAHESLQDIVSSLRTLECALLCDKKEEPSSILTDRVEKIDELLNTINELKDNVELFDDATNKLVIDFNNVLSDIIKKQYTTGTITDTDEALFRSRLKDLMEETAVPFILEGTLIQKAVRKRLIKILETDTDHKFIRETNNMITQLLKTISIYRTVDGQVKEYIGKLKYISLTLEDLFMFKLSKIVKEYTAKNNLNVKFMVNDYEDDRSTLQKINSTYTADNVRVKPLCFVSAYALNHNASQRLIKDLWDLKKDIREGIENGDKENSEK